ncbi:uncharacterized protein EV154DRAFT_557733 [Mucor mucedo]|uniref:uncharacterized protein n=1 Tax=Mucor mucedo TaxID=29922 RepID=UPI00222007E8|nr:uncharacterized protein EV154DRAFT_557733 [Mucor mucedo]KAI7897432.1 hypothetical protein EV154DRAFT_557733 [Mucor mucedo]
MTEQPSLKRKLNESPTRHRPIEHSKTSTDTNGLIWSRHHWSKLEEWYIVEDRDYVKAAEAYYSHHCIQAEETWTLAQLTKKSRCLDTFAKAHDNLLPSELQQKRREIMMTQLPPLPPQRTPSLTPQGTPTRMNSDETRLYRSPVRDWSPRNTLDDNDAPLQQQEQTSPYRFRPSLLERTPSVKQETEDPVRSPNRFRPSSLERAPSMKRETEDIVRSPNRTLSRTDSLLRQSSYSEDMPPAKYPKLKSYPSDMSLS